ncbi:MAG: NADP-dependent phosphogluconate dehydrogenase [Ahrensia sp.]|nr:NADP-dependent phosphogluconate dehydrogenase [Ahrensia sp.]
MDSKPNYGLYGLGTMGAALALNIAEKGYDLAVCNRTASVVDEFHASSGDLATRIVPTHDLAAFVSAMAAPRNIVLMVPAGDAVDKTMEQLRPFLDADDLIIDAGNANFGDTNRRGDAAQAAGEMFLGIGVSGGEEGARHGPSIMGGGNRVAWNRVSDMLEAIAADYEGTPCAACMGEGGSGHYVKMVHNGIEYADMQMIAEVYGIMRDGLAMTPLEISKVFSQWNEGRLQSYLIEISASVAEATDPETGKAMLDIITDSAGQKGTGRWTAIEALMRASPVTAIDAAVAARNLSSRRDERKAGEELFGAAPQAIDRGAVALEALEAALLAGKIACYAQGFAMLSTASDDYGWSLPLPDIAKVWRAGCIIRSSLLDDMAQALDDDAHRNLMFAPSFAQMMKDSHKGLRKVVAQAALAGHAAPALSAALSYFDAMRTARGTANMIQAQRDFFGAHGFERLDREGQGFHGPWGTG